MEIQQFEEQLTKGPASLKVTNEIGSITIVPGSDDNRTIHVDAESRGMVVTVSRSENTVTVRAEREEAWRNPIEQIRGLFNNEHPQADLTIQVPADCDVNAKTIDFINRPQQATAFGLTLDGSPKTDGTKMEKKPTRRAVPAYFLPLSIIMFL